MKTNTTVYPRAVALQTGTSLTVVDYLPLTQTVTADDAGSAVVAFDAVPQGYMWLVDGMSVRSTSASDAQSTVWAGPRLMDGSYAGVFDFSDRAAPVLVAAGEQLQVKWTGCTPGAACTFDGQYQLVMKG